MARKDGQTKKEGPDKAFSEAKKKYDEAIAQNGELTQADVDQANTDAEEAKNAVTEQECQVESAQKEADAAKQALDDAEKKRAQAEADVQKAKEERDAAKQTYLQEAEKST